MVPPFILMGLIGIIEVMEKHELIIGGKRLDADTIRKISGKEIINPVHTMILLIVLVILSIFSIQFYPMFFVISTMVLCLFVSSYTQFR